MNLTNRIFPPFVPLHDAGGGGPHTTNRIFCKSINAWLQRAREGGREGGKRIGDIYIVGPVPQASNREQCLDSKLAFVFFLYGCGLFRSLSAAVGMKESHSSSNLPKGDRAR